MRITPRRVLGVLVFLLVLLVAPLFLPNPRIRVGPTTTRITTPLAEDGLPDFGRAILNRSREGVTSQNNGAIPFWKAMWTPLAQSPELAREKEALERELGMTFPHQGRLECIGDRPMRDRLIAALSQANDALEGDSGQITNPDKIEEQYDVKNLIKMVGQIQITNPERIEEQCEAMLEIVQSRPWTTAEFPALADWVQRNEEGFALLHEAASRPKFHSPSPSLLVPGNPNFVTLILDFEQQKRGAVRALATRALFRIGEHDFSGAWKDCLACERLGQTRSYSCLVSELVNVACLATAAPPILELLAEPQVPPELLREIQSHFATTAYPRTMADAVDQGERFLFIDQILRLSGQRHDAARAASEIEGLDKAAGLLSRVSADWNQILERGNARVDRIVEAYRIEDFDAREAALAALEDSLSKLRPNLHQALYAAISRKSRSDMISGIMESLLTPPVIAAIAAEDRMLTQQQLLAVAVAIAMYRSEHGSYPKELSELVPQFLATSPVDLFHQKALIYKPLGEGYLLYSCGPNGIDDGGSNSQMPALSGYPVESTIELEVLEQLRIGDPATPPLGPNSSLSDRVPANADDHSIRIPRIHRRWPPVTAPAP